MFRSISILVAVLIIFAACTNPGNPVTPEGSDSTSTPLLSNPDDLTNYKKFTTENNGLELWGDADVIWDPTGNGFLVQPRKADSISWHGRVTFFLNPPYCNDCLIISLAACDPSYGTGTFDVTVKNPTNVDVYDVRAHVLYADGTDLEILNADGFTNLFETEPEVFPAPFKNFAAYAPQHKFCGLENHTVSLDMKTSPGVSPVNFTIRITAGVPEHPGDVSSIGEFRQVGQLLSNMGTALVSFDIVDLQNDINGVYLHTDELGWPGVWLLPSNGRWKADLTNYTAQPGIYNFHIEAHSPNFQNAVTSHYFKAVVFHDYASYRNQMLALLNQDRANNGLTQVVMDETMNTVAQYHGQDMADKQFFAHVNLDGWTPWKRMDYYGIEYFAAGENIAVGQDTPEEVETAWMNSTGHRANILNSSFGRVGLGIIPTPPGDQYAPGYYWVQVFAN